MKKKFISRLISTILILIICASLVNILRMEGIFPFKKQNKKISDRPGRWRTIDDINSERRLTEDQKKMIKRLESIGYLSGTKSAPDRTNVTAYDKERAYEGLNLVVSGHGTEAILIDMDGNELHKWSCDVFRAWPDFVPGQTNQHTFWRRAHLMENGDLIAIFEGIGMIKLDKSSNLIWRRFNSAHHDFHVTSGGNIYALTRKAHINEKYNKEKPILEDYISVLDSNGREIRSLSVLSVIENSFYSPILHRLKKWGDILHSNTVELIENETSNKSSIFTKGRVLLSIYWLDFVCVVDLDKESVVWGESDLWEKQHQPSLLKNGNILVFDNLGAGNWSRVFEFDPVTRKTHWNYGNAEDEPFYTPTCGSCQRLPNGNTLITESDPGRAFEVTLDKTIVWEFINPHRVGENNELIATLFEVVRLEPDFPTDWLQ